MRRCRLKDFQPATHEIKEMLLRCSCAKVMSQCFLEPLLEDSVRLLDSASILEFYETRPGLAEQLYDVVFPFFRLRDWVRALDEAYVCLEVVFGVPGLSSITMDFLCGDHCGYSYKPQPDLFHVDKTLQFLVQMSSHSFLKKKFEMINGVQHAAFRRLVLRTPGHTRGVQDELVLDNASRSRGSFLLRHKDVFLASWIQHIAGISADELDAVKKDLTSHVARRKKTTLSGLRLLQRVMTEEGNTGALTLITNKIQRVIRKKERMDTPPSGNPTRVITTKKRKRGTHPDSNGYTGPKKHTSPLIIVIE
jgi:hypothetical protein